MGTPLQMTSIASPSPRHNAKKSLGPGLPNATKVTHTLKGEPSAYHAALHKGSSLEIKIDDQNKHRERQGWEFEREKELVSRHRAASVGSSNRLNSWQVPPTDAQAAWNSKQKVKAVKRSDVSITEKIARERRNQMDKIKMKQHEGTKEQTQRIQENNRARGLEGRRGDEHDDRYTGTRKYIDEKNYHHDAGSGRTAAHRSRLLQSAVVQPSKVEHSSTHQRHGHLTEDEMQDYLGLRQGEELDEEGRVIPPWAVQERRAQRYLGPMGEDYTKYNADYPGMDVAAQAEWSARAPPPQMYLRDDRGKNVKRSDPRLPHDAAGYGQPFGGPYARLYESPAAVSESFGYPTGPHPALGHEGYGHPGYAAYGHPALSAPGYGF